jgi:DNA-binding NarL/FixJ family response regulator/tetratricopeptide (TPR) repeat protein
VTERQSGKAAVTVLVADDQTLLREMMAGMLRAAGYAVLEAGDGERAVQMAFSHRPELVLMEPVMPGMSGIDATRRIVRDNPAVRVVMLSRADSAETVRDAVRAGAAGYLTKAAASSASLLDALQRAFAGEMVFAPADLRNAANRSVPPLASSRASPQLTARELEIITLAAVAGKASPAVAMELGLSTRTVENHLARIYKKLGVNSRTQLARAIPPPIALAGRAAELGLLDGKLRALAEGGGAVLIEGEPGIGKSALVRAALGSSLPGGCQVFWGAGDEMGQELPLLPFLDALEVRRPSANARRTAMAGLLRGEVAADRGTDLPAMLAEQLIALTIDEAAARPVVLVIDDLQWADPASVKLWARLARTARHLPVLLIGMSRPVPQRSDLLALRRAMNNGNRIQLDALSESAVAELVVALSGGRPDHGLLQLAARAAGNPLYLTEMFAALARSGGVTVTPSGTAKLAAGSVPHSLPGAIADRLGLVSAPTRNVLRAAALLGVQFTYADLTTVLGRKLGELIPALNEARTCGVLTDADGTSLAFRHPMIRDAIYGELPVAVRTAWHREAGHALAANGAAPSRVARQLLRAITRPASITGKLDLLAGEPAGLSSRAEAGNSAAAERAADFERPPAGPGVSRPTGPIDEWMLDWLAASADSLVAQAPGVAAELLGQAVDQIPPRSAEHIWLASRLADALYRTGDVADAEQVATRALATATDPDLLVDLHWTLAQCRLAAWDAGQSLPTIQQALAAPGLSVKHRGRLLVLSARTRLSLGSLQEAGQEADRALASASEIEDTWGVGWALHVLAYVATARGDLTGGLRLSDRALAVAETDPALTDLSLLLQVNKAVTLFNLDRVHAALDTAGQARRRADQVGTAVRVAQAHSIYAQALYEMGRWDDALTEMEVVPEDLKDPLIACCELGIAAKISFHRNLPDAACRYLAAADAYAERLSPRVAPPLALGHSMDREEADDPGAALVILTSALEAATEAEDPWGTEDLIPDAVRLALKAGDKATARTLTERFGKLADKSAIPHQSAAALYCRGMVDRAPDVLLASAHRYAEAAKPLLRAKALEAAAGCLADGEDRAAARRAFDQAVGAYKLLGAEADLNRIRSAFHAHGIRQRRWH